MRKKMLPLLCISCLTVLTSCGSKSLAGRYGFQLGKANGTHFGFFLNVTDNAYVIPEGKEEEFDPRISYKACSFSFSISVKNDGNDDSLIALFAKLAELFEEMEGGEITLPAYYYTTGVVNNAGENEMKIGFDFSDIQDAIEYISEGTIHFPSLTPDTMEKLVYTTYIGDKITLHIPVSEIDLLYQLYWYGIDINLDSENKIVFLDSPTGVHPAGSHPQEADITTINETYNYETEHSKLESELGLDVGKYRDYYTLSMGLLKQ